MGLFRVTSNKSFPNFLQDPIFWMIGLITCLFPFTTVFGQEGTERTLESFRTYVKSKIGNRLNDSQLEATFKALDKNQDGKLSDAEFQNRMSVIQNALSKPNAKKKSGRTDPSNKSKKKSPAKNLKYHTYQSMLKEIRQHEKKHPKICKVHDLGVSSDGKTHMWALKISDNVEKEEDEPTVLLTGAIHGNERPAPEMALYTINQLLSDPDHKKLINSTQIWVIPIMNTAGHVANTRQNANRKDLNRGFPQDWKDDSLDGLEIETKNLIKNFYRKRAHVVAGIDLHTFGEVYLMPYACSRENPADFAAMSVLAQRMSQSAGYRPMKLTRFIRRTVKGGGADYRYGKYGTFYYGLELGRSHRPPEKDLLK